MAVDIEAVRMQCLKLAIDVVLHPNSPSKNIVELATAFAAFVLGLKWDDEADEWVEPEREFDPNEDADDSELAPVVRAYNDEGQEL